MKRTIRLVGTPGYLSDYMHSFLVGQCEADYKETTCSDESCNCKIIVYDVELPAEYHKETQKELETIIRNSNGNLRMYVTTTELIEGYE